MFFRFLSGPPIISGHLHQIILEELLFPKQCFVCKTKNTWLCSACRRVLPSNPRPLSLNDKVLDGFFSPFLYKKEVRKIISAFKFEMVQELSSLIADLFFENLRKTPVLSFWRRKKFIFLPLPLHYLRQRWRGFNQSLLIVQELSIKTDLPFRTDILLRSGFALPQVGLSQKKRQENIKNQFLVQKAEGKNLIVFDDVWTTGATLHEAGKSLKKAGAKLVWGATFCC